jgi:hypothetical protein
VDVSLHNPAMTMRKRLKQVGLSGLTEERCKLLMDVKKVRGTAG